MAAWRDDAWVVDSGGRDWPGYGERYEHRDGGRPRGDW